MKPINKIGVFNRPIDVEDRYQEFAEVYIEAFKGPPWFEVSQCPVKDESYCPGGFSPIPIGKKCENCNQCPVSEAYEIDQLVEKFTRIGRSKNAYWYSEDTIRGLAMVALAWETTSDVLIAEKYPEQPEIAAWIFDTMGTEPFVWLDEVFADKRVRASTNLRNFAAMTGGFALRLDNPVVAYRTITAQMLRAGERIDAKISDASKNEVPDRRNFIVKNMKFGEI